MENTIGECDFEHFMTTQNRNPFVGVPAHMKSIVICVIIGPISNVVPFSCHSVKIAFNSSDFAYIIGIDKQMFVIEKAGAIPFLA